jgi:CRISPR-associated protein Csb2
MPAHLTLSVTFLNGTFHGRRDAGEPEWPPSPLRLFQSLVAANASELDGDGLASLDWLAKQPPPSIVAPPERRMQGYCLSVPNNALDKVGAAWSRGNTFGGGDANPATHRTMKTVQPLQVSNEARIAYNWPLLESEPESLQHATRLCRLARRMFTLGWGTDFIAADGRIIADVDPEPCIGEYWRPRSSGDDCLRVPNQHTLGALRQRHALFLKRVVGDGFIPVPSLPGHAYARVSYRADSQQAPVNYVAFKFLSLDHDTAMRPFNARRAVMVAGMLRHAAGEAAKRSRLSPGQFAEVMGHAENHGESHQPVGPGRLSYVPIPTIEPRQPGLTVSAARRALVVMNGDADRTLLEWAGMNLAGSSLIDEASHQSVAILAPIIGRDSVVGRYVTESAAWTTVTPMVLPGHDDRRPAKIDALIRKAIVQAGFSEAMAQNAEIESRPGGFLAGVDLAGRYSAPRHLERFPRRHVRIVWKNNQGEPITIQGPIILGGGRHAGLGLFTPIK